MIRKNTGKLIMSLIVFCLLLSALRLGTYADANETAASATQDIIEEPYEEDGPDVHLKPLHIHSTESNGSDTAVWSYITFGQYCKSEISNNPDLFYQLEYQIGEKGWGTNEYEYEEFDIELDDPYKGKYRVKYYNNQIQAAYKFEPIKWRILEANFEEGYYLVVSDSVLCKGEYDPLNKTWENSIVRKYLNGYDYEDSFISQAFTNEEQEAILSTTVVNAEHSKETGSVNPATEDKIFLLSYKEATSPEYGFCRNDNTNSKSREFSTSDYLGNSDRNVLMRTLTGNNFQVMDLGKITTVGSSYSGAVAPAMRLDMSKISDSQIKKYDHSFGRHIVNSDFFKSAATCTKAAQYYIVCDYCNTASTATYDVGSPLGHD